MSRGTRSIMVILCAILMGDGLPAWARSAAKSTPQVLVREGKPVATIVIPDTRADAEEDKSPEQTAREAAGILNDYLRRACGTELPVVAGSEAPAKGALVLLGRSSLSDKEGIKPPTVSEGVRIATFPRGVAIVGEIAPPGTNGEITARDRGTIHGVYLFLEKCLGFRFLFDEGPDAELGVVVPEVSTVSVDPINETFSPAFPYRMTHDRAKGILLEGSSTGFRCNHTHEGWDVYYKESHPEYFALKADGSRDFDSLCYSNPDVLKQELNHIEDYYRTGRWVGSRPPTAKYIQVEPVDNWSECQCEGCQALVDPAKGRFGRHSRLWWDHYIFQLAQEVKKRWPDKRIAALAYQGRLYPGEKKLPDNVDVMVCIHNGQVSFQKEPQAKEAVDALLAQWSENLDGNRERMFVWDYQCYPAIWTTAPVIFPHLQQKFLKEHGDKIGGLFLNRSIDHNHQYTHFMEALTMRLLWDPELDVDAYLRDYCEKFYGPGAAAMERVYRRLIDRYEQTTWPGYDQPRDTAWVSTKMLLGRTYPPKVIEEIEQDLYEAQEAVGRIPGGRVSTFPDGEGWFVRRNGSDHEEAYRVTLEAADQPVQNPTLRWESGQLSYKGTLRRGQKLVIEPGPKARLLSVAPEAPRELIPPGKSLAGEGGSFGDDYTVHSVSHLGIPTFPGAKFHIAVSGHAEGGSNSYAEVTWRGAPPTFVLDSRFSETPKRIRETFAAPPGAQALESVRLFRRHDRGVVTYSDLSLRREFDDKESEAVSEEGEDVTERIAGDVPVIPARTTALFHLFARNSSLGVQRQKVDRHLAQENGATAEDPPDAGLQGGAVIRVALAPQSGTEKPVHEPSIFQRRVAWMRDALEDFHPQRTMYTTHDGFLPSARVAHRWLSRRPQYQVAKVDHAPAAQADDVAWSQAAPLKLVRGQARAKVPLDNLGFDAGNGETEVRILQDEKNLYVFFQCDQPEPVNDADELAITFHSQNGPRSLTYKPRSGLETEVSGATGKTVVENDRWDAFLTIPKSAVVAESEADVPVDITRTRRGGLNYLWSPPLDAPWVDLPAARRGRLKLDGYE